MAIRSVAWPILENARIDPDPIVYDNDGEVGVGEDTVGGCSDAERGVGAGERQGWGGHGPAARDCRSARCSAQLGAGGLREDA